MVTKLNVITCDGDILKKGIPKRCNKVFSPPEIKKVHKMTATAQKRILVDHDWHTKAGRDFCSSCWPKKSEAPQPNVQTSRTVRKTRVKSCVRVSSRSRK